MRLFKIYQIMNLKIISNYLMKKNKAQDFEKKIVEYENKINEYKKLKKLSIK